MEKILVINNDFDTMQLLKKWLQGKKYSVKYTSNGDEALGIIEDFKPDVMLVDVLHKQTAKELKDSDRAKKIPLILMTGYTMSSEHNATDIVDDVIEKPFDPQILEEKIKYWIKNAV